MTPVRQTYGYAKQAAGRGYSGVKGLNALLAIVSTPGSAPLIAAAAPEGAHVVKVFNPILRGVLAEDKHLDVFFAGDSAEAKARVAAFLESLDMRPLDAGGLEMAHVLEWAGILLVGLARNGDGFDIALGPKVL